MWFTEEDVVPNPILTSANGRRAFGGVPSAASGNFSLGYNPVVAARTGSGFLLGLAFLVSIVLVGRVFDRWLRGLHLPAVICAVSFFASLAAGGFSQLRNRVGFPLLGLIGWMFLCVPFAFVRGDAASVTIYFAFFTLMWLPISLGPRSMKDIIRLILLFTLLNAFNLTQTRNDKEGRLMGNGASFANAEDIALIAVISIPFLLLVASRLRFPPFKVLVGAAGSLFLLRTIALTGSRAILLAALGMATVYFFRSGALKKAVLVIAATAGLGVVIMTVPDQILDRLATVVDAFGGARSTALPDNEAMASAQQRHQLLMDSLRLTITHPLFGVGPGQFASYRWSEGKEQGIRTGYFVTHNAYTEISSETGIVGLAFFIAMLVGTQRTIQITRRLNSPGSHRDWKTGLAISNSLQLSFVAILICGFFLANAQYIFWYLMGGIALALERVTRHLISLEQLTADPTVSAKSAIAGHAGRTVRVGQPQRLVSRPETRSPGR